MRIHYLQHVAFEDLGAMQATLTAAGHSLSATRLFEDAALPMQEHFDALIVMGGPMSVHDEATLPWLRAEKHFIKETVANGKPVLGICLGAQLLADVLGGTVHKNAHREIGWWPVTKRTACAGSALANVFPDEADVFHWHGDTFSLPAGAELLCTSAGCQNQGFVWNERVVALQFHLETTAEGAQALITHCSNELDGSRFVQDASTIAGSPEQFRRINTLMDSLLAAWLA